MNFFIFLVAAVFNAWFVSFSSYPLILIFIVLSTVFLIRLPTKKSYVIGSLLVLTILQLRATPSAPLLTDHALSLHNRFQQMRAYPVLPLPIAYWVEERVELRLVGAFVERSSILVSPNYYFFANHPRGRAGVTEIEKFPIALLPFSVLGLLVSMKKRKILIFLPLSIAVLFGLPTLMYPLLAASIYEGLTTIFTKPSRGFMLFLVIFLITLLIQYVFANY